MRVATVLAMIALAGTLCAQTIPHTEAETLAGKKIVLPDGFAHHPALIIIGFSRAGGDSAGRWGKELRKHIAENSAVQIYSIAVLQDAPKLMRGMIKHGMRSGTPKSEQEICSSGARRRDLEEVVRFLRYGCSLRTSNRLTGKYSLARAR